MKKRIHFSPVEISSIVWKVSPMSLLLLTLLLLSFSILHWVQAQGSNPANADPRRVPPSALWNIALRGSDIAVGSDGNPVVAGSPEFTTGIRVTKVNEATGAIVWDWVLESESFTDHKGIAVGSDGNPVVVATVDSGSDNDFRILKLNGATGAIIWDIIYDAAPGEFASAVAVGLDGNPVVTGRFDSENSIDLRTAKLESATGALLWSVSFDGGGDDNSYAITIMGDGNPVIAGESDDGNFSGPRIIRYDGATGATIWNAFLVNDPLFPTQAANGIAAGPDGNLVIAGENYSAKIDGTNGALIWSHFLEDGGRGLDVAIDSSGNPVVTGNRNIKYDGATGEILWILPKQGGGISSGGIAIGPDGKLIVTGQSTVKYDGTVNHILWVARAANLLTEGSPKFVAIGNDGNPVVIGNFVDTGEPEIPRAFQIIKYDGATGAVLWSAIFDTPGDDFANGIAVGLDGNPVVVGSSDPEEEGADFRIVKYNGMTGAVIWSVTFDSGISESAQAVAIGPEDNPIVVGSFDSGFRVIKFNGITGAVLWNETFSSDVPEVASAIAVGPDGNPVVAGTSDPFGEASSDFRLVKYDDATGSIIWNVTFDSGAAFGDRASSMAIGPDNNPVIIGTADFFSFVRRHTIKYDGATGEIIWNSATVDDFFLLQFLGGVAIGIDGNPLVTGIFEDPEGSSIGGIALRTSRYDGATGSLISATDFDTGDAEESSSVAVGPDGNPVSVVTTSLGPSSGNDLWIIKYLTETETAVGSNISIGLNGGTEEVNGATVTFSQVTVSGNTTFFTSASGPALPSGFSIGDPPLFYDISTTTTFAPPVTICIAYEAARFGDPNNVRLLHFENNAWVDVTTFNDTINHVVCGQVNGFSLFAVAEALPPPPVAYNFTGFFPPVNTPPTLNSVNSGRAIPVKFSLGGFRGFNIFDLGYPKSQIITCSSTALVDGIEETVVAGSSGLSYDAGSDRYIYAWKTDKTWAGTCRQLVIKLNDGTFHRANFKFLK